MINVGMFVTDAGIYLGSGYDLFYLHFYFLVFSYENANKNNRSEINRKNILWENTFSCVAQGHCFTP